MSRFLTLHEHNPLIEARDGLAVFINVDQLFAVHTGLPENGGGATVAAGGQYINIKETYEEVVAMLRKHD